MSPPAPRPDSAPVAVLGAGPAGLTAAYRLARRGVAGRRLRGRRGGRRPGPDRSSATATASTSAATASSPRAREVEALWEELLGPELLVRPRLSRIYWRGRFIEYPLRPADVFAKVGPLELARSLASYARARLRRAGRDGDLRGLGQRPLRPPPLRALLQDLHGKGLGGADRRAAGGVGGAADRRPLDRLGAAGGAAGRRRDAEEPDRRVPLPAARPGADVGGDGAAGRERGAARSASGRRSKGSSTRAAV